jgi:hypothetical protein
MKSSAPHDDASIKARRRQREQELRGEQRREWDRFESLTRSLLRTPKSEIDKKRRLA